MARDTPSSTLSSPTIVQESSPNPNDHIINVEDDHEESQNKEGNTDSEEDRTVVSQEPSEKTRHSKLWSYIQGLPAPLRSPRTFKEYREEDGRKTLVQRIDDHPEGYPQFAAFLDSDANFLICRKFGWLRSRVLLSRQDELNQLERRLLSMDDEDKEECPLALRSRKIDDGRQDIEEEYSRKTLLQEIDDKLEKYDQLVSRMISYVSKPLTREESRFTQCGDDLVALSTGQEDGCFDGMVEDALDWFPRSLVKSIFTSAEQRKKTDDKYVHLYSKRRIDFLVRVILSLVTVLLLLLPTALLFMVPESNKIKLVTILLFTLLFSAALMVFTKAKRHEMFGATAA
ncbi:MAG: hypothetical protein Q9191_007664, partial [Dirinaria sp. TL-2023a]